MANHAVGLLDGDAELVPCHFRGGAVCQGYVGGVENVGNVVLANEHLSGVKLNDILVVAFRLVQRVVFVDVFHIGQNGVAGGVDLGLLLVAGRVAFLSVVLLVAVKDATIFGFSGVVPISGAEVMVVISRGVIIGIGVGCRLFTKVVSEGSEVNVLEERAFVVVAQTVETDILVLAGVWFVAEGAHQVLHDGDATPNGGVNVYNVFRGGQAVFVKLSAVGQNVF